MSQKPVTIKKTPALKPAGDYYLLRREGIGYIEQMGSRQWTDYNTHDPGITILEALCYAITDLAFRTGQDIRNILTKALPPVDKKNPYPDQAFFTARNILTINPWTNNDFRRLLIDAEGIRNAWLICKECACDLKYYAWCEDDKLTISYSLPENSKIQAVEVFPRGLYDVLLELEDELETGDLNNRRIEFTSWIHDSDGNPHPVIMEIRFPDWKLLDKDKWDMFLDSNDAFNGANGASFNLTLKQFGATKSYDVTTDPLLDDEGKNDYLHRHWRNLFYADLEIELLPGGDKITIEDITIRFIGNSIAKNGTTVNLVTGFLTNKQLSGILQQYRSKMIRATELISLSKDLLHSHRNLDEDYCKVRIVDIEEIAVCADIEVTPDADIEKIQARVWFEIERYLNPPVSFYSLQDLINEGVATEDIFNGPELNSGFIKAGELEAAQLKSVIRTSDIINLLMEIDGVVAINNLLLSKYDSEGNIVKGAADPVWVNGNPVFDASKTSAEWLLFVKPGHQPRLYQNLSRFLFFRDGLPFKPRMDEALDTLLVLRGEAERPRFRNTENDLFPPLGLFTGIEDYYPVQYSFPLVYGVGTEGLPSHAGEARRAQAKQLRAYLLVFEQLLGNAFSQVAHTGDLFSLDPATNRTYFVMEFAEELIRGYNEITNGLDKTRLEKMTETLNEFHERRNRFLDHLMARFGEQFSEYTLLMTNLQGKPVAAKNLIEDKTAFLKAYPKISHDRAKAFNYTRDICESSNISGLKKRINLLLGYPDLTFTWTLVNQGGTVFNATYLLNDPFGKLVMSGELIVDAPDEKSAASLAGETILKLMIQPDAWEIQVSGDGFVISLIDNNDNLTGTIPGLVSSKTEATGIIEELINWSNAERTIVAEHLLLRPKFPGDALYPACTDGSCHTCGDEDPYSFRLTLVMPGWTGPFSVNTDARRFADKTIRQEIPSHLLGKICWVGNDGFIQNLCDEDISEITGILMKEGLTETGTRPSEAEACACANQIYILFSDVFKEWYQDKALIFIHPDALNTMLENAFSQLTPGAGCTIMSDTQVQDKLRKILIKHFVDIVINGWQFERFEAAWCAWLKENSAIDWTEEMLQERVEAMLKANFIHDNPATETDICNCAGNILTTYGIAFNNWMNQQISSGIALADLPVFDGPQVELCGAGAFNDGTDLLIGEFLNETYNSYRNVSYTLQVVVTLLGSLKNVYPGATLHDCDSGSDQNPVRLGSTSLGNYPMKRTLITEIKEEITEKPVKPVKKKKSASKPKTTKSVKRKKPPMA